MIKPRRVFARAPKREREAPAAPMPVTLTMHNVDADGRISGFTFMGARSAKAANLVVRIDSADKLQLKLRIESTAGLQRNQLTVFVKNGLNHLEEQVLLDSGDMIEVFVDGWQELDPKPSFRAYLAFSLYVRGGSADA